MAADAPASSVQRRRRCRPVSSRYLTFALPVCSHPCPSAGFQDLDHDTIRHIVRNLRADDKMQLQEVCTKFRDTRSRLPFTVDLLTHATDEINGAAMEALAIMCTHTGLRHGNPQEDCFVEIHFLCSEVHMPVLLVRDSEGMVGVFDLQKRRLGSLTYEELYRKLMVKRRSYVPGRPSPETRLERVRIVVDQTAASGQDDMQAILMEMVRFMKYRHVDGLLSVNELRNGREHFYEVWKHNWQGVDKYHSTHRPAVTYSVMPRAPFRGTTLQRCHLVMKTECDF